MSSQTVLLHPRPYSQPSNALMLVPLLPMYQFNVSLPPELWTLIFESMINEGPHILKVYLSAIYTCKVFKDIVDPLLYSRVSFERSSSLEKFSQRIHEADAKWDSLRRIPYSTPGRWVNSLDVSRIQLKKHNPLDSTELMALQLDIDTLLSNLFPLLPFLSEFFMSPTFIFSQRAFMSLDERHGIHKLRALRGIFYLPSHGLPREAFVDLLRNCPHLEELEVIGPEFDPVEQDIASIYGQAAGAPLLPPFEPLSLPKLRDLTLLSSIQSSPLMLSLLSTPLPSLTKLTISPFDDVPFPASSLFISRHGKLLRSLLLLTRKSWPTRLHASPANLFQTSPSLRHLSLELPLPALELTYDHHLEILSIPKPSHESWALISRLLPHLPSLKAVRIRDVKWLRKGMGLRAMETGVQGEMRQWRRRLARRGVRVLDGEWKDADLV